MNAIDTPSAAAKLRVLLAGPGIMVYSGMVDGFSRQAYAAAAA